jgi:hypothetical protein
MNELITFSYHSIQRMRQRGLTQEMVLLAIQYGRVYHRQGFVFSCVAKKDIEGKMLPALVDRIKNVVVVLKDSEVVTTYRTCDSFSKVRKKSKRILSYNTPS